MDIEIDITEIMGLVANVKQGPQVIRRELQTAARQSGMLLTAYAMDASPVDTGYLRANIGPPEPFDLGVRVTSHADYSKAVHDGTGPHVIVPRVKQALYWPGARHPVKRVNHPGTKANPYMRRALRKAGPQLTRFYEMAGQRIGRALLRG